MTNLHRLALLLSLPALLWTGRALALADGPTQALRRTNTQISALLRKKVRGGSEQEKQVKRKLKETVNSFLDFEELARLALGRHWEGRTPKQRAEFVGILRELIERSYLKQIRGNLDYKLDYRGEQITGDSAHVHTVAKVVKDGRAEEVSIDYKMRRVQGTWLVFDVVTDDVSIVRNYKSQFNRIIVRESYDALVKKMRRKLETI
ncbi:MAG: ABC transporter substrate-binding protein [Deltaproteobacteria bacterium]|nr:ABC transporter substrate-binding protein [Deltaproteobacteria bacterium]